MVGKLMMHTKVKSFILIAGLFALLASLNAQTPHKGNAPSGKAGLEGKWYLQAVLPSDTAAGKLPEIVFNTREGRFSGNTGCNSMQGSFQATDSSIRFNEPMITTKMMCVGYNEGAFLKNLIHTNTFKIQNGLLILLVDGTEISRWSRKITKPKKSFNT
ncbi:MAG TPA: META domain-containing protein [Puia sp.]